MRPIRFVLSLLLVLGFSLTSAPTLSMEPILEEMIVPDADGDECAVSAANGNQQQDGTDPAEIEPAGENPLSDAFNSAVDNLQDFLEAWLATVAGSPR
jgi:hypothetical protein